MKRLLLLVTAFGAWFASSAQLVDVVIEEFDPVSSGYSALYLPAAGQVTYRVYAEFGSPLDKVSALYGLPLIENAIPVGPCQQTVISTTTSWWNEAGFGTNLGSAMNCTFFGFVPALGGDSWLTIGAQCSADAGAAEVQAAVIDPPTLTPHFNTENGTSLVLNDGAVFTLFTSVSGFGTGPNNRVLLAQLTTDGEISFELNLQVFLQNDQAQEVRYVHSTACSEDATIEVDGSALGLIYPAPVQSVPGCTDPLACNYDINADTDDGTCILPDGCTDMAACNYDDTALCDDGSCDYGASLDMTDSFGDGWDGATYTITDVTDPLNPVFVASGDLDNAVVGNGDDFGTDFFCLADGCYNLTITEGGFPDEIGWTLNNVDAGPISGGAPADVNFTVNSAPCPIAGCTDSAACNYDVDATIDDGSCFFPPAEDECANAIDLGSTSTSVAGSNINACNDTEVNELSGVFYTFTLTDLAEVSIETSSTGANDFDTQLAIFESCGGPELAFNDDGGFGLYSLLTFSCGDLAAGTYIIMVDGFGGQQGDFNLDVTIDYLACSVILGCTDPTACNYDENAVIDDGSCIAGPCINDLPSLAYALPMNALGVCNGFNGEDIDAATVTAPEGLGFASGDGRDLWYSFVPTTSAVRIEVNTADFDAIIELQDASNNLVDFEDVIFINGSEAMNVEGLTVGDTYYVRVYSWLTTEAPALFDICVQSVPASRCDYGPGPYSLCNTFKGQWVLANDYIFTFTSQTDGAEYVKQQGFANTFVQLFTVADLPWGDSYDVEVSAVFDLLDGAGNPESVIVETNVPCEISIIDQPLAQLTPSDNQANYGPHFLGNYVSATPWICSTVDWTWEFINTDGSQLPIVHQRGASNRFLRLSDVPGLQPGAVYEVRVKPEFSNGSVTGYGATQLLAIIGSAGMATEIETPVAVVDDAERFFNEEESNLAIYPNPNKGEFVNLNVTNIADGVDRITVDIYDTYGKLVISRQLATTGSQLNVIMPLDGIASGVYTVSIIVDGEVRTERMIVQK